MARWIHRRPGRSRLARLAAALAILGGSAGPASATAFPFAVVVDHGFAFQPLLVGGEPVATAVSANRPIHALQANGQKAPLPIGEATIVVWNRSVPDAFFDPIGPLAGLGVLTCYPPLDLVVHLALIGTPGGFRTTIGVRSNGGTSFLTNARGEWIAGPAATLPGANPDDMGIGGVLVLGTAVKQPPHPQALLLNQYFPSPAFFSQLTPLVTTSNFVGDQAGSFYGYEVIGGQARPVRTYTMFMQAVAGQGRAAHLAVAHLGGDDYRVVVCAGVQPIATSHPCTLSGTGATDGMLGGSALYYPSAFRLELYPWLIGP